MGINSTEVSYGFGQFGSAITDSTSATLYPPRGLRIVAITALADTTFDASAGLVGELNKNNPGNISVSNYITTEGAGGHVDGEITDADPHNANGGNAAGVITLSAANTAIKVGMYVHTTGTMLPYSETNPYIVKSISSADITLTKLLSIPSANPAKGKTEAVNANKANGAYEPCYFYSDLGQGVGGLEMDDSDTIPKGVTIYGRWTSMNLNAGRAIVYFGA